MLKVLTVTDQPDRAQPLLDSLTKHGWEYSCVVVPWQGFGTKLIETYNFLRACPWIKEFVFCDAHDVLALGGPAEFEEKLKQFDGADMVFSAEKGCWPPTIDESLYGERKHDFNYLNSGLYYAKADKFRAMMDSVTVGYSDDDQYVCTQLYFMQEFGIVLDRMQVLFNSHSHIAPTDYTYNNNRVQVLGSESVFVHKNGGTVDEKFNENIKI